jgi:MFS family permease
MRAKSDKVRRRTELSDADPSTSAPKHDAFAALRQRNFQLYALSRIFATLGNQMLQAILAWQIYDITGSPLSLGFLGLARFFPALALSMFGGTVADTYDRRKIMLISMMAPLSCALTLAIATSGGWVTQTLIYGLVVVIGLGSAFEAPARTALLPALVKPETFGNAVTVANVFQKLGSVSGPTLAGVIIATLGITTAYGTYCGAILFSAVPLLVLRYRPVDTNRRRVSLTAMKEGVGFVKKNQVLLGAMSLDMFAVIFGGAQALLPVYAKDILHGGATAFGLLTASLQIGAFLMSFVLVAMPPVRRTGRALIYTVVVFGLGTMAFGLSRDLYVSLLLYGLIGAADQISVVMRQTTIQLATPDELRGRVSSVQQVFVQASSQIGAIESGFVAAIATATFAVVSGGAGAIAVAILIGWRMPLLFHHEVNAQHAAITVTSSNAAAAHAPGDTPPKDGLSEQSASAAGGS